MIATIILAAGGSRRLGKPKQLVAWHGNPLVRHAALVALEADLGQVIVVLGAVDAPCREALTGLPVEIVTNADWETGMGGSIAMGVAKAGHTSAGAIVMLCDQPFIDASFLRRLATRGGKHPVISSFGDGQGPPAFFPASYIKKLRNLHGHQGARSILRADPDVEIVPCPQGGFDLDTPEDEIELSRMGTKPDLRPSISSKSYQTSDVQMPPPHQGGNIINNPTRA